MRARRTEGDRGATLLEFAFVFPILALLFAAMADLGFVVLGSSVASGAARDGARVGIIHYEDADDTSSSSFDRIDKAVKAKLVGWIQPGTGAFVTVRCLDGDNLATVKPCDAAIDVDLDVIEVTVSWEALAATGLLPVDRTQTDRARMVITGGLEDAGGGPIIPGGSTIGFSPVAYATTETDSTSAVSLTVTRTNATGTASVNVVTAAGSATDPADFTALTTTVNLADGQVSASFTVDIAGDDVAEGSEAFTLQLSNPIGATLASGGSTATVTIADDDGAASDVTPPALQAMEMRDIDTDGRVDQVIARFNETLGACNAPAAWTLASVPSNGALASVAVSGTTATLTLTEGAGAQDTAVGGFTLALSAGGICDTAGNNATFGPTAPSDFAGPVLIDFTEGGGTEGRFDVGDFLELTFTEALLPTAVAPSDVVLTDSPSERVTIPGVTNGSVILAPASYIANNRTATFNDSPVTYTSGNTRVRVVLGACTGDCSYASPARLTTQATAQPVTMSAAPSITDLAGRAAVGTFTKSVRMF